MNLKIFPDLVSNIDVKMIIKRICDKEETAEFKSPWRLKSDQDYKDEIISFSDFESILVQVALLAYGGKRESSMPNVIIKLFKHIREPSLLSYSVKLRMRKLTKTVDLVILTAIDPKPPRESQLSSKNKTPLIYTDRDLEKPLYETVRGDKSYLDPTGMHSLSRTKIDLNRNTSNIHN